MHYAHHFFRKWWPKILTISICWKAESLALSSQKGNVQSEDVWHSRLGHAKNLSNIFKPARKYTSVEQIHLHLCAFPYGEK
ncbi:hypothetical protein YC2023_072478 [Brassica napus]